MSICTQTVFNKEGMPQSEAKGTIVIYKESAQPANPVSFRHLVVSLFRHLWGGVSWGGGGG